MGLVGGGGNIAIATAMGCTHFWLSHFFLIVLLNSSRSMGVNHQLFYVCPRLRFLDVETNPGQRRPVRDVCRILCSNVRGLYRNLSDLTMAASQFDILLCSETLVSDMRHMSESLVPGFGGSVVLCRGRMPRARGMEAYVRDGFGAFRQPKFECGCCEMLVFMV